MESSLAPALIRILTVGHGSVSSLLQAAMRADQPSYLIAFTSALPSFNKIEQISAWHDEAAKIRDV